MTKDVEAHIVNCDKCIHFKRWPEKVAMENIQAIHPLELVHLDYLTMNVTKFGKDVHISVITDHYTQHAQALVTSSWTAMCTAEALWDRFIVDYGILASTVSDQGQNSESDLTAELCQLAKVQKLHTSPFHPQTNGQCECYNRTSINMLGTWPPKKSLARQTWCWLQCMNTTAVEVQLWVLVHTISCMAKNPNFQLICTLVLKVLTWMPPPVWNFAAIASNIKVDM